MNENTKKVLVPAAAGVVGFIAGSVSTLYYVRRQVNKELEAINELADILAEVEEDAELSEEDEGFEDIVTTTEEELEEEVKKLYLSDVQEREYVLNPRRDPSEITVAPPEEEEDDIAEAEVIEETPSTVNVFEASNEGWDWEAETAGRTTVLPYILHQEEYFNDEKGYSQSTLTYYEGDSTLVDELQTPIQNINACVGKGNLRWGHGTADSNTVYIRNDRFKSEYEVLRDPGMYSVEVLGNDVEDAYATEDIRHSKHTVYKFAQE